LLERLKRAQAPLLADSPNPSFNARSDKTIDCGIAKNLNADKRIHCDLIQLRTAVPVRVNFHLILSASESTLTLVTHSLVTELARRRDRGRDENSSRRIGGQMRRLKDLQN
jgi:hypothetical protein